MPRNYYAVLRVSHDATSLTIHNTFRSPARQYHPDSGPGSSPDKSCEIAEAYQVLRDPERRRQYDVEISPRVKYPWAEPEPLSVNRANYTQIVSEPLFVDQARNPTSIRTDPCDFEDVLGTMLRILRSHFEQVLSTLRRHQSSGSEVTSASAPRTVRRSPGPGAYAHRR